MPKQLKNCKTCGKQLTHLRKKFCSDPCQRANNLDHYMSGMRYKIKSLNEELDIFVENLYRAASIYNEFVILQETIPISKKWKADIRLLDRDIKYEN